MRRTASVLSLSVAFAVGGCQKPETTMEPKQQGEISYGTMQPDMYATTPSDSMTTDYEATPSSYETTQTYEPATSYPAERAYEPAPATPAPRTHVVVKGDTLYGLARQYYDNAAKWRDIYDANRSVLRDPNTLRVGQELVLP